MQSPDPNFTDCATRVLKIAGTAARWCQHERVGPEHVLFGVTQMDCGAADILKDVGATAPSIRHDLETLGGIAASTLQSCFPSWCRAAVVDTRPRHEAIDTEPDGLDVVEEVVEAEERWLEEQAKVVRLTNDAKSLLRMAQTEASNLGHEYVGTEHLLVGMLWGSDPVAARALEKLNLDPVTVRKRVWAMTVPENGWEQGEK